MYHRQLKTAEKFNIVENCCKLEAELMEIPGVKAVDFDLDGFYDNMGQVIFLTKYHIPYEGYYEKRREMTRKILTVAAANGLTLEDPIEDQGTWLYFVTKHNKEWRNV